MYLRRFPVFVFVRCLVIVLLSCIVGVTPASLAAAASSIPGYAIVPLTILPRTNQTTVRVAVNGQSTMLILDTGASTSLLDRNFYKGAQSKASSVAESDLPAGIPSQTKGNGLKAEVGYVSLKAGNADFGKGPVSVMDLSSMFGAYNSRHGAGAIGGLLGEDVLRRYAAIIDWRRRGVYFNLDSSKRMKNLGKELTAGGWTAVPMSSTSGRRFTVPCTVGSQPAKLLVDTGAGFTAFSPGIVPLKMLYNRDTGPSMARLASLEATSSMIGGDSTSYPADLEHWKIGAYEIDHSTVAVHRFPPHSMDDESPGAGPMLGLLGPEILARNNAIIDIAGSTLYLKRSAAATGVTKRKSLAR